MKREKGHYWCNYYGEWDVYQWDVSQWWYAGWESPFEESEFKEIDERRVVREVLHQTAYKRTSYDLGIERVQELDGKPKGSVIQVGTTLRAIDPCVMDISGEATLTVGRDYTVAVASETKVFIIDDAGESHQFTRDTLGDYFVVVREPDEHGDVQGVDVLK